MPPSVGKGGDGLVVVVGRLSGISSASADPRRGVVVVDENEERESEEREVTSE